MPTAFRHVTSAPRSVLWQGGINYAQLRETLDLLEVAWPVKITGTAGTRRRGCHRVKRVNGRWEHHITLSRNHTVEQINETLIHELTHAAQCERIGDPYKFSRAYLAADDEQRTKLDKKAGDRVYDAYRRNPFEVEARETAEALKDELRLTRRGK